MKETTSNEVPMLRKFDVQEAVRKLAEMGVERWMEAQGFPPSKGCQLYLPLSLRDEFPAPVPDFIEFHPFLSEVVLINKHPLLS
jgi:hypothetical protein